MSVFGSRMRTVATPTAVAALQRLRVPISARNSCSVHCGVASGLPIKPGGSVKLRSFGSATGSSSVVWLTASVEVSWNGCEPACVSVVPFSFSGRSSYFSIPNCAGAPPIVTACLALAAGAPPPEIVISFASVVSVLTGSSTLTVTTTFSCS